MSGSSRRPATRNDSRQILVERRKQSVQHRYIHQLFAQYPPPRYLDRFPDNSCHICDPRDDDITSPGYQTVLRVVREFDPNITISGRDQNNYYTTRVNRRHTFDTLQQYLESLTFWRIPADFYQLTRTLRHQYHDTVVGHVHDLTEALEESYIAEVDAYLTQQEQNQYQLPPFQPTEFPPTPDATHSTPVIQRQLNRGRQLFETAANLFEEDVDDSDDALTIQTRDSIGYNEAYQPQRALTDQERSEFGIEDPDNADTLIPNSEHSGEESDRESEADNTTVVIGENYFDDTDVSEAEQAENRLNLLLPILHPVHPPIQRRQNRMVKNVDYPVFNGTKPAAWAKAMDIAFKANQVDDEEVKISIAAAHLGDYVDWFVNQADFTHWTGGAGNNHRNLRAIFLTAFNGPEEKGAAIAQMWKRKQRRGETIASYANGLQQIWSATDVDIPEPLKLSQFIGGLDVSIQTLVRAQNPQTIADAIAASKRVYTGGSHASYLTQEESDPTVTGLLTQVADLTKKLSELKAEMSEPTNQPIQRQRYPRVLTNNRCSFCDKNGHADQDCWFKSNRRPRCFKCGQRGHIQKDCYAKKKPMPGSGKGFGRP